MTEIQRRVESAKAEVAKQRSFDIEREFRLGVQSIRTAWVKMASLAWAIKQERLWQPRFNSIEDFLAQPGIDLEKRFFYKLAELHEQFVERRKVPTSALEGISISKALEVVPAIRDGKADTEAAIEDARDLTVLELREKYAKPKAEQEPDPVVPPPVDRDVSPAPAEPSVAEREPEPRRASPSSNGTTDEADPRPDAPAPAEPLEPCPTCGSLVDPERIAA